jgi:4-hydroxy-tetrahydrodipicolinate reductase
MADMPGIVVTGASGRMGQMLIRMITASDKARLVGCVERTGHPWVGRDVGEAMGGAALGVVVTRSWDRVTYATRTSTRAARSWAVPVSAVATPCSR